MAKMGRPINQGARMRLIDAAALVLRETGREMDALEMLQEIYARGLWRPASPDIRTADCSLRGEICKEMEYAPEPRFRRVRRGYYAFRPAMFAPVTTQQEEQNEHRSERKVGSAD